MRRHSLPVLIVVALTAVSLAGCVGNDTAPPDTAPGDDVDVVAPDPLVDPDAITADSEVPAPQWEIGEVFGQHMYFGPDDSKGTHMNAVVVMDHGDAWMVAPDDPSVAKDEATFDLPIFGEIKKDDLSSSAFGDQWTLYDFPIKEGKTWSGSITVPDFDGFSEPTFDVTFTATFDPAIVTPAGPKPGFQIEGKTAEGQTLLAFDYTPAIGWYAHFYLYDLVTEDEGDYLFHVMNMGHDKGWTGTYYVTTSTPLVETFGQASLLGNDGTPAPEADPQPHNTFTVADSATYIYGFVFSYAFTGAHDLVLVDPNNEVTEYQAVGQPMGFAHSFGWIDQDAVPGDWQVFMAGAAVASGGGAFLYELTETTATL